MADAAQPDHPRQVAEAALAHKVRNQIEAAYRRTDLFERRRRLMGDWAAYLAGELGGPGDRQCARSSNLSRRWRLRQQCRHSTLGSAGSRVKPSTKLDQAQKVLRASADCATALVDLPLAPAPIDYQSPMDFKRSHDEAE